MKPLVAAVAVLVALVVCVPLRAQTPEIDELRTRAEQGDAEAQNNLGEMYEEGRGVPQDWNLLGSWKLVSPTRRRLLGACPRTGAADLVINRRAIRADRPLVVVDDKVRRNRKVFELQHESSLIP